MALPSPGTPPEPLPIQAKDEVPQPTVPSPAPYDPFSMQPKTLGDLDYWIRCLTVARSASMAVTPVRLDTDNIPGLPLLQAYADAEVGYLFYWDNFRAVRGRVAMARRISPDAADALTFAEAAEVLMPSPKPPPVHWLSDISPCPGCDQLDQWNRPEKGIFRCMKCGYSSPIPTPPKTTQELLAWCEDQQRQVMEYMRRNNLNASRLETLATHRLREELFAHATTIVPHMADFIPRPSFAGPDLIGIVLRALGKLIEALKQPVVPVGTGQEANSNPLQPPVLLTSWREILHEIGYRNTPEKRRLLRELNEKYNGPLMLPDQGGQPKVDKGKFLAWWQTTVDRLQTEYQQRQADKEGTLQAEHAYGKDGTVFPDLAGHLQKRRQKRRPDKT